MTERIWHKNGLIYRITDIWMDNKSLICKWAFLGAILGFFYTIYIALVWKGLYHMLFCGKLTSISILVCDSCAFEGAMLGYTTYFSASICCACNGCFDLKNRAYMK